jgi:predicted aspartyl protease
VRRIVIVAAAISTSLTSGFATARAAECRLERVAEISVDVSQEKLFVPVSIEGVSRIMAIDTGAPLSAVDPQTATDLQLKRHRLVQGSMYVDTGKQFTEYAVIQALELGRLHARNVRVLVWPEKMSDEPNMAGTLGADVLRNYDVDIDLGSDKLSLFLQDHCPGKVVYWNAPNVAVVPIRVVSSGHIIVPITLDGHEIDALLDTGSSNSYLSLEAAQGTFGLAPDSPDLTRTGEFKGPHAVPLYQHRFKSLSLEGVTISNPLVLVWEDQVKSAASHSEGSGPQLADTSESGGMTQMILGLHALRGLHVYIAYKEQKLYLTATDALAPAAPDGPPPGNSAAH